MSNPCKLTSDKVVTDSGGNCTACGYNPLQHRIATTNNELPKSIKELRDYLTELRRS